MVMSNTEIFLRCEALSDIQRVLDCKEPHTNFHLCSDDYDTNNERKLLIISALMHKLRADLNSHKAKKKKNVISSNKTDIHPNG